MRALRSPSDTGAAPSRHAPWRSAERVPHIHRRVCGLRAHRRLWSGLPSHTTTKHHNQPHHTRHTTTPRTATSTPPHHHTATTLTQLHPRRATAPCPPVSPSPRLEFFLSPSTKTIHTPLALLSPRRIRSGGAGGARAHHLLQANSTRVLGGGGSRDGSGGGGGQMIGLRP